MRLKYGKIGGGTMDNYKLETIDDKAIKNVHHIGISYDGNYYSVVFGECINGGFFSIPNWNVGGELSSSFSNVFWNGESIARALKRKKVARQIALAIAEFGKDKENGKFHE